MSASEITYKSYPFFDTTTSRLYFNGSPTTGDGNLYYCSYNNGTFGSPVQLPFSTSLVDCSPRTANNGTTLIWSSTRAGGYGYHDLWEASYDPLTDTYGTPVNFGPLVNGPSGEWCPSFCSGSPDSAPRGLYFDRDGVLMMSLIPEPSTLALLVASAIGLLAYGWRRRKRA